MLGTETAIQLPMSFDVGRLQRDLEQTEHHEFSRHPLGYHDGSWSVINLIYAGGETQYRHEGAFGMGDAPPRRTPVLDECPYFDEVLAQLPGEILMARLSALPAGGKILRHYDPIESVDFGNLRLHIPIRTSPEVVFHLAYRRRRWSAGEVWYGDFTFPHSVWNRSAINRVHLIVDLKANDELTKVFPPGYLAAAAKQRRARLRRWHKDLSWYHEKLDRWLGRSPTAAH